MVCIWRPLVEKCCIFFWQARVGREIERYKRAREEEMRKPQGGKHWWLGVVLQAD
jgi:hypothetical protein